MTSIRLSNLSKAYRLYNKPSDRLKEIILRRPYHRNFYALKDINIDVMAGETLGVIGENGAGKSTLLKILARTLKPSSGDVSIEGRVAALLELGAGFNPDLTGEENIYLNGYLMGLTREEITQKRQEIIDFAEIGEFISHPVKTYSSGMQVRLAFSIATSVNPDVLIVDEALSVGDEYFQKKSVDRMMSFKKKHKTIVFCSHSMYFVQEICDRALWIHNGYVKTTGAPGKVIMDYQGYERSKSALIKDKPADMLTAEDAKPDKQIWIEDVKILDRNSMETISINTFDPIEIHLIIRNSGKDIKGHIGFAIIRNDEVMTFGTTTSFDNIKPITISDKREVGIKIPSLCLLPGIYSLMTLVADENAVHPYDIQRNITFSVMPSQREFGIYFIEHEWIF